MERSISGSCRRKMSSITRWTISIVVLVGVASQIMSCRKATTSTATKITYAMPITIAAIPAYVAAEKGFWKEEGLDVQTKMFSAGRLALDALLAKDAEVMSVSETPLIHAILQGHEIYIVATVTKHQETKAIVRTDHGITAPGDLRSKRIATLPGTNSDYFMYQFLNKYGLKTDDVNITNMPPPDMVTAFVQGSIDGYFAWEPHIYYAQHQLPAASLVFPPGDLYYGRHCVAMNKDYVDAHPDVVEKLVKGFVHAERYIADHRDESISIVSRVAGVDSVTLRGLWDEYTVSVGMDSQFVEILNKETAWAAAIDHSPKTAADVRSHLYDRALNKVRAASPPTHP